jgi:nitrous oxidase accessory protein NosD
VNLWSFSDAKGEIAIPAGEHLLSEPLVFARDVRLRGAGAGKSRLRFDKKVTGALMVVEGATVLVEGVDVTGAGRQFDIITGSRGALTIRGCKLHGARRRDAGGDAICVEGDLIVLVEDCELSGNAQAGATAYERGRIELRGSILSRNGVVGLKAWETARVALVGCRLDKNGEQGVLVQGEVQLDIDDCDIARNGCTGVQYEGRASGVLSKSRMSKNADANVYVADDAAPRIADNELRASMNGVYVVDRARPVIDANRFIDNDFGVYVRDEAVPAVTRNYVQSRGKDNGIVFCGRAAGEATDNDCTSCHVGFVVEGRARPLLARNVARHVVFAPKAKPRLEDNAFEESSL